MAIAIRTAVIKNNTLFIQSGAGVVADSDPTSEWGKSKQSPRSGSGGADGAGRVG
ncbi:chorismate-binding protein [Neisseria gonorrhoeae]